MIEISRVLTTKNNDEVRFDEVLPKEESAAERPHHIPERFWDNATCTLRTEELVNAYLELEKTLNNNSPNQTPSECDSYCINITDPLITVDPEVNSRLYAAGLSNEQVQLVYELAAEKLAPLVAEVGTIFETENQISRLIERFGGEARWREISRQLAAWGKSHLPSHVYGALATTYEGVVTMFGMMESGEPELLRGGDTPIGAPTESDLRQMMRDPRYWRDQEPGYVEKIREGFQRLYPGRG